MTSLYLRKNLHLKDISQYNDFLFKIDVPQLSCKQSWSEDMERGNDGTIFPQLAASTRSVGVLNSGEAQFEGVWVRPSWKNTTKINDMQTTGFIIGLLRDDTLVGHILAFFIW